MNAINAIKKLGGDGMLTEADIPELNAATARILELMNDGKWHGADEIIECSGQREGLRRLRSLRSRGFTVERKRNGDPRNFVYRVVIVDGHAV